MENPNRLRSPLQRQSSSGLRFAGIRNFIGPDLLSRNSVEPTAICSYFADIRDGKGGNQVRGFQIRGVQIKPLGFTFRSVILSPRKKATLVEVGGGQQATRKRNRRERKRAGRVGNIKKPSVVVSGSLGVKRTGKLVATRS